MSENATRRYYQEELAYLRELGEAFGRANPDVAPLLSSRGNDPDVERLMEGFAFLAGRLRQRADEELPELAQGLLSILAPHALEPLPAMTMLRFDPPPVPGTVVPAGAQVLSRPVDGVACRFRTTSDLLLLPAEIAAFELEDRAASATLTLRILARGGPGAAGLGAGPIRLFLHGAREAEPGPQLLHALLTGCVAIEAGDGRSMRPLAPASLRHAALDEPVLPWPEHSFAGLRLLREYLAFPARMLFLDLPAVPNAERLQGPVLEWRFRLDRRPELPVRPRAEHLQLNVVPAINLFAAEAEPVVPDPGRVEHRLRPQGAHPAARILRVEAVEAGRQGQAGRIALPAFASYSHARPGAAGAFHVTRLRPAVTGRGAETWIAFVDGGDAPATPAADVVSASLTCTDGELCDRIPIGGVDRPGWGCPPDLPCRNVVPVTPEAPPPLGGDLMWRLIAGLAQSMSAFGDLEALRALIASLDHRALREEPARQRLERMLGALLGIASEPLLTVVKGVPVHGRTIRLEAAESAMGGTAALFLLGAALEALVAARAPINTAFRFEALAVESRQRMRWPPRHGAAPAP